MSTTVTTGTRRPRRPRLSLLRGDGQQRPARPRTAWHAEPRPQERQGSKAFVLVAGADAVNRGRMLEQLRTLFPQDTSFAQADETWQVVAQAADSRLVVLTGDLADLSARGVMRVLSRRHPLLPVVALGNSGGDDRAHGAGTGEIGAVSL